MTSEIEVYQKRMREFEEVTKSYQELTAKYRVLAQENEQKGLKLADFERRAEEVEILRQRESHGWKQEI